MHLLWHEDIKLLRIKFSDCFIPFFCLRTSFKLTRFMIAHISKEKHQEEGDINLLNLLIVYINKNTTDTPNKHSFAFSL